MMDTKRITNFSTKTASHLLMQSTPHAPAKLQNRYLFGHRIDITYRTDELSYVRAMLKHQLNNR